MSDLIAEASGVTWLIIAFISMISLYLARTPIHQLVLSTTMMLHKNLRLASHSISQAAAMLTQRNKTVLLAAGKEHAERMIEREFERVESSIQNELSRYPTFHRELNSAITHIEEDYAKSTEVPPEPTAWSKAVIALAKVDAKSDPMIAQVMDDVHKSMKKAETKAIEAYRQTSNERHQLLKKMMPRWRSIQKNLTKVDKNIQSLLHRGSAIDRHMDDYNNIIEGSDDALRTLSSSSLSQFFISLFVLTIAVGGAIINFNLIARPMAEMVGGTNMVGAFKTADIAAMVIILVEISMGLFLMECLRITRLFPVIHTLNDRIRIRMMWIAFTILLMLAMVEAGLAFMREILMQDDLAISAHLIGADTTQESSGIYWITTASQMGMGFILPFALTFVAIPLENFIASVRTVVGMLAVFLMRMSALICRMLGASIKQIGKILVSLYDILIFIPLSVQSLFKKNRSTESDEYVEQKDSYISEEKDAFIKGKLA